MGWNPENVEKLKELWQEGYSAAQVAERLGEGISRNAVIGKIHRLGLEARQRVQRKRPTRGPGKHAARAGALRREVRRVREALPPPPPQNEVGFLELKENLCRWPNGDPDTDDVRFCGTKTLQKGVPYCDYHMRLAYQPGSSKSQKKMA